MHALDDDPDPLERTVPALLLTLRKQVKKTQLELGSDIGGLSRQQVSNIERGTVSPAWLTGIVRRWMKQCGIHPRSAESQSICMQAGYPVCAPDCLYCLNDVAKLLEERAIFCPHVTGLIPDDERATIAKRHEALRARKPTSRKEV